MSLDPNPDPRRPDPDPLRHHRQHRRHLIGPSLAERAVEFVAEGIGTVAFLGFALTAIILWITINGGYGFFSHAFSSILHGKPFDPAPWILLNLCFSFEAFFTGSLVIIAARAQAKRDQAHEAAEAKHREELHQQVVKLIDANTQLTKQVQTQIDANTQLTKQVHAQISSR